MADVENRLLMAALNAARYGFRVVPLVPRGKRPLRKGWIASATTEPARIEEAWRSCPEANVGIACGSGLVVLDADSPAGEAIVEELGMPPTTTVQTARGTHYYLSGYAPKNGVQVATDLDVRSHGGLVAAPGSIHGPTGHVYEWITPPWETPPAPVPEEIQKLLSGRQGGTALPAGSSSTAVVLTPDLARVAIGEGERNVYLHRVASSLRGRFGLAAEELLATLRAMNAQRCHPPLPDAELISIVSSVSRYPAAPPWVADPQGFAADPCLSSTQRHVLVALARYADAEGRCFPSIERLRRDTGKGRNAIVEAINGLERAGRISVVRGGQGRSNRYRLMPWHPSPLGGHQPG